MINWKKEYIEEIKKNTDLSNRYCSAMIDLIEAKDDNIRMLNEIITLRKENYDLTDKVDSLENEVEDLKQIVEALESA